MAIRTITGTLTIPASEQSSAGVYTDLVLQLVLVNGGIETIDQTSTVTTANNYSFTFDDSVGTAKVKLRRISNNVLLSETSTRGVLPRSFLLPSTDVLYPTRFKTDNYLFDAGLSIIACAGGKYFDLAKEITEGIIKAETTEGALPFKADHVLPGGADKEFRTGTIAAVAYSLGYYLEQNPLASNKAGVADALNDLLIWLCAQRKDTHKNLLTAGYGRDLAGTFDPNKQDSQAITVDNILAYFAFKQAGVILNPVYLDVATELAATIKANLYQPATKKFLTSLYVNGSNTADSLELNYMGSLFYLEEGDVTKAEDFLDNIEASYKFVDVVNNVDAYKATTADTKVWFEGSYAVAMCYYKLGDTDKYSKITKSLNKLLNDDGSFRWGMLKDGQYKVLDYKSVGSTAWSYIATQFPDEAFTINTGATLVTGVVPVYINHGLTGTFTRQTCNTGETPGSVSYKILPGKYNSLADQTTVDATATTDLNTNGQAYADANGTCQVPYTYFNTLREGLFMSAGCLSPSYGAIYPYSVAAGAFGSNISQNHANALADAKLIADGQAYADNMGVCMVGTHIVVVYPSLTISDFGFSDEVYLTMYATEAVNTFINIDYEYSTDNGFSWIPDTVMMQSGSSNTFSFFLTSMPSGAGNNVQVRITSVSPDTFAQQVYDWGGNISFFNNTQRSAFFIKNNCGTQGIDANSVKEYVVPANWFTSHISQEHADALADAYVYANGQSWVNATAYCAGINFFSNTEQSGTYQKQGCGPGYEGSWVTYSVPAGTYVTTTNVTDANNLALADIANNGQAYANSHGLCTLTSNSNQLWLSVRVDSFGMYDDVYIRANSLLPVADDIAIDFNYWRNGMAYLGNGLFLNMGETESMEIWLGQFNAGEGQYVEGQIWQVYPNPGPSGTTYIF